ncbi:MAG: hypothetical protein KAV97_01235 [Actinomycetia bacterium]|nr:hypothetical protein [Actinomycetes bacterium]
MVSSGVCWIHKKTYDILLLNYINREGCQVNNSVTFSGKPMGFEEFLNQMDEVLGIIMDRCPKGRHRKRES